MGRQSQFLFALCVCFEYKFVHVLFVCMAMEGAGVRRKYRTSKPINLLKFNTLGSVGTLTTIIRNGYIRDILL